MIEFVPACSFRCDAYGDEAALTIYRLWCSQRLDYQPCRHALLLAYF